MYAEAHSLWERLRSYRREIAKQQGVWPSVIFSDATLREMVTYRPRDGDELSRISGVGVVKLERYGAGFLRVLAEHEAEHGRRADTPLLPASPIRAASPSKGRTWDLGLSGTVRETLELFRGGVPPAVIGERRDLKITTIYTHLARCIEEGELSLRDVVTLNDNEIAAIEYAFSELVPNSPQTIKPVYDAFEGQYDYGLLRCVRVAMAPGEVLPMSDMQ
jgi:ATP-dependent DNA helicase RecQ